MYVTMLIAVPHYPDMIMAFVLSQTKSDLHLKNLRGKKKESQTQQETVSALLLACLPIFYSSRRIIFIIFH